MDDDRVMPVEEVDDDLYYDESECRTFLSASELTPEQWKMWRAVSEEEIKEAEKEGYDLHPILVDIKCLEYEYHYKFDKQTFVIDGKEVEMTEEELDIHIEREFQKVIDEEEARWREERRRTAEPAYEDEELAAVFRREKRAKDYIFEALSERGNKPYADLYKKAGVTSSTFGRVIDSSASKATMIAVGVTLGFDNEKLNEFLMSEGFVLSPNLRWDKAIVYCLNHNQKDIDSINVFLKDHELATLEEAAQKPKLCKI